MANLRSLIAAFALIAVFTAAHADPVTVTPHKAPALTGETWVNGAAPNGDGKVRVLLFWTRGCINCKHNLGYWNEWAKAYKSTDVEVVSVHTPEGEWEHEVGGVREFAKQRGLAFPILIDNDHANWDGYGVRAWPTEILIDRRGTIRYQYEGELNWNESGEYKTVRALIEKLRAEK